MARKPTKLQQQYKKEIANLKRRIKTAEKRGFIFTNQIIPTPKRIDQRAIKAVQAIRTDKLYEKAEFFVDQSTGEAFGTKGIGHALRQQAAMKGLETRKRKRKGDGGIRDGGFTEPAEELYSAYFKVWSWVNNFQPDYYTGKRKNHNIDWEERWRQQAEGAEKIKRLLEVTEERYIAEFMSAHNGADDELQAQQYAQQRIGKNLKASGIDIDEAMEGFTYDSKSSTIILYVNRVLGAIIGRPLTMEERMDFTLLEDDGIDYTSDDDFPI